MRENRWIKTCPQNGTDVINRQDIKAIITTIFLMCKEVEVENFKKIHGRHYSDIIQTSRYQNKISEMK